MYLINNVLPSFRYISKITAFQSELLLNRAIEKSYLFCSNPTLISNLKSNKFVKSRTINFLITLLLCPHFFRTTGHTHQSGSTLPLIITPTEVPIWSYFTQGCRPNPFGFRLDEREKHDSFSQLPGGSIPLEYPSHIMPTPSIYDGQPFHYFAILLCRAVF